LLWAALPPVRWWPLAWIAPLFWLRLIAQSQLAGRRPYGAIWLSSVLYWVVVLQGIRLAHWANYLGLVALGAYLGIYVPLFVAVARRAVHRWRVPLLVAAPMAWTGMELIRGYGPLGFSMALLGHTQVSRLSVIQVADLFGAYTISFLIMSVAAALYVACFQRIGIVRIGPALYALALIALDVGYGQLRLSDATVARAAKPSVRVALIQGSIDTIFEDNPQRPREIFQQYSALTEEACARYGPFDLIVWPESMFPLSELLVESGVEPQLDPDMDRTAIDDSTAIFRRMVRNGVRRWNECAADASDRRATAWLLGTTTWQFGDYPPRRYNAALLIAPDGQVAARYYKMHPVMFGEFVPWGEVFPSLYKLFPLPNGLSSGTAPVAISVGGLKFSPSICFESIVPQLIRSQVAALARRGTPPDVLVNLTNDGWFWGSSILDLHLDCAVLRAVELRRPLLVAANTGFSAWISGQGELLAKGPRRDTGVLVADVTADGRWSGYQCWGDAPAAVCALFCLAMVVSYVGTRWRRSPNGSSSTVQLAQPLQPSRHRNS
jgi:apolipoprotein N-acyltransferase